MNGRPGAATKRDFLGKFSLSPVHPNISEISSLKWTSRPKINKDLHPEVSFPAGPHFFGHVPTISLSHWKTDIHGGVSSEPSSITEGLRVVHVTSDGYIVGITASYQTVSSWKKTTTNDGPFPKRWVGALALCSTVLYIASIQNHSLILHDFKWFLHIVSYMFSTISPCVSMDSPMFFHDFSVFFDGFSQVFPWFLPFFHGFSHVVPGFLPFFSWFSHDFPIRVPLPGLRRARRRRRHGALGRASGARGAGNPWDVEKPWRKHGEIHGKFLGNPWKILGKSMEKSWEIYGKSMEIYGKFLGNLWTILGKSMENLWKILWKILGNLWKSWDKLGCITWI